MCYYHALCGTGYQTGFLGDMRLSLFDDHWPWKSWPRVIESLLFDDHSMTQLMPTNGSYPKLWPGCCVCWCVLAVLFICVIVFSELIWLYVFQVILHLFMDIEETSAVELLYADEFELYTEEILLRPVRPSVWRVIITCICRVPTVGGI